MTPTRSRGRCLALTALLTVSSTRSAAADNGALAYAREIPPIQVDGDLDDWDWGDGDEALPRYAVAGERAGGMDAVFRVAYNREDQALYVALEVPDDAHVAAEESLDTWYLRDAHTLYVDPEHTPAGSAPFVFSAAGETRRSIATEKSWSAVHRTEHPGMASHAFARRDGVSIYEWRIALGDQAQPGATLGLDHIVTDIDTPRSEGLSAAAMWGHFEGKSERSGRLGDVLLVPAEARMGTVAGSIAWAEGTPGPDLSGWRVRITNETCPTCWLQVATEAQGAFDVSLPAGEYTIASPFLLYDTPAGPNYDLRLEDAGLRRFTVRPGLRTDLGVLEWSAAGPLEISSAPGFLFSYDSTKEAELTAFLERALDYYQVEGASVALVADGKLAFAREFGLRNRYSGEPVDANTLFEAGSVTKAIFSLAVLRMAEREEIDLDRPLHTYLPFDEIAQDPRSERITARLVLSHQTGLPNWREDGVLRFRSDPGIVFSYSGEAFEYLGRVVAKISGRPLGEILRDESLAPFGADPTNVVFADEGTLINRVAFGHDLDRPNTPTLPSQAAPAYSMHTNARALAPVMEALLTRRGLSDESYEEAFSEHVPTPDPASSKEWPVDYGLGMQMIATDFGKAFSHTGLNGANNAIFEGYLEQNAGFLVFTNSDVGRPFYLALREFLVVGRE